MKFWQLCESTPLNLGQILGNVYIRLCIFFSFFFYAHDAVLVGKYFVGFNQLLCRLNVAGILFIESLFYSNEIINCVHGLKMDFHCPDWTISPFRPVLNLAEQFLIFRDFPLIANKSVRYIFTLRNSSDSEPNGKWFMSFFKVLRCSKMSMNAGEVMELVCDDTHRLATMGDQFLPNLVRQSAKVIVYITWLLCFVGWKFIPGLCVFTILALFRLCMTNIDIKFRKKASQLAEKRLGYLREVLTIIHSVKLNCLEHIYEEKIQRTRWWVDWFHLNAWQNSEEWSG